ncbi:MAG: hypothetical protein HC912_06285 [Saprospiraceae bacterium]|nr:hypothetical protein [Saprospiraceae bacterium]
MKEAINKYVDCPKYNGIHISKDKRGRAINLRNVKNKRKTIINYVTKYVTKSAVINSSHKRNENLMWHCSRSIAQLKTSYKLPEYHKRTALAWANSKLPSQDYVINTDFCLIVPLCEIPDNKQKWFWNYLEMQEINFLLKYDPGELQNRYSSEANINIYAIPA